MKLSFVNGNFDDIINVLSINFPVEESIEVGKAILLRCLSSNLSPFLTLYWIERSC